MKFAGQTCVCVGIHCCWQRNELLTALQEAADPLGAPRDHPGDQEATPGELREPPGSRKCGKTSGFLKVRVLKPWNGPHPAHKYYSCPRCTTAPAMQLPGNGGVRRNGGTPPAARYQKSFFAGVGQGVGSMRFCMFSKAADGFVMFLYSRDAQVVFFVLEDLWNAIGPHLDLD